MEKQNVLLFIRDLADRAHGDQVRKYSGERYIAHPVRVMETCRAFNDALPVLAAALLHDVLEDTRVEESELFNAIAPVMGPDQARETVTLVEELTDIYTRTNFPRMNRKVRKEKESLRLSKISGAGQTIKYADIIDNVTDIVRNDTDFARIYLREARHMLTLMTQGNAELRQQALHTLDQCETVLASLPVG